LRRRLDDGHRQLLDGLEQQAQHRGLVAEAGAQHRLQAHDRGLEQGDGRPVGGLGLVTGELRLELVEEAAKRTERDRACGLAGGCMVSQYCVAELGEDRRGRGARPARRSVAVAAEGDVARDRAGPWSGA
jgi:hypothetical protein